MQRHKRRGMAVSALVILSMIASACGPETPSTAQPTATTGTAATQVTTEATATSAATAESTASSPAGLTGSISFQVFGDPAELNVFKEVVAGFNKAHPGPTVNIIHVPNQGDHMSKISAAFASGDPPDVFLINYRRFGQFAAKKVIEPAGPLLAKSSTLKEDMYYPQVLEAFRYKGELQCIPQNISSLAVYYNKDMFKAKNVAEPAADWTWNDFLNTALTLTQDTNGDGKTDVYGAAIEPQIIRVAPFVWQNGGEIVDNPDKPTTFTLKEGPAREAVQFFMDLRTQGVVPTEAEAKAEDGETAFMNGRVAMVFQSRAATPSFREIKGFQWDVAPLPMGKQKASILHSDAYCIAAASKNKDLAWAFVEYAQGVEGQTIAAKLGRTVPSLKSVAESPAFLDPTQSPANSKMFLDIIPTMKLVPVLSTWPKIEGTANEELEQAFYKLKSVDDAIDMMTKETTEDFAQGSSEK